MSVTRGSCHAGRLSMISWTFLAIFALQYGCVSAQQYLVPPARVTAFLRGEVLIPCSVQNRTLYPHASTRWHFNRIGGPGFVHFNSPFFEGRASVNVNGSLLITNLTMADAQGLSCDVIDTNLGIASFPSELVVVDPPTSPPGIPDAVTTIAPRQAPDAAPGNVMVTVFNDTTIDVTWNAAMTSVIHYRPTGYRVELLPPNRQLYISYPVNADQLSLQINDLTASTLYRIHVLAFNNRGDGPASSDQAFTTYIEGYKPTTAPPTSSSNAQVTPTSGFTTPMPTTSSESDGPTLILGLASTVFIIIVGVVVIFLVGVFLLTVFLYCRKAKKLKKEREYRVNSESQIDMIRGVSHGTLSISALGTPRSVSGSVMTMPGAGQFPQFNNQIDCPTDLYSPHRKRKLPRPGGIPALAADHSTDLPPVECDDQYSIGEMEEGREYTEAGMEMNGHSLGYPENYRNAVEYYQESAMMHPPAMGYVHGMKEGKFSNMSTMSRQRFQYGGGGGPAPGHGQGQEEIGIVIPPPPARTPPPLQVGDYPQSYPQEMMLDDSPDYDVERELTVLPNGEKITMAMHYPIPQQPPLPEI